ncbi:MAG: hypothetical protein HZA02_10395 [Nitrospinae bacterium]|nr:hypothetical protein [Nitrospinota bacterium]
MSSLGFPELAGTIMGPRTTFNIFFFAGWGAFVFPAVFFAVFGFAATDFVLVFLTFLTVCPRAAGFARETPLGLLLALCLVFFVEEVFWGKTFLVFGLGFALFCLASLFFFSIFFFATLSLLKVLRYRSS